MTDHAAGLYRFWNLWEGLKYLWVGFTADDPLNRRIARRVFLDYWFAPLFAVCLLEVFWHGFFHFVVGW